MSRIQVGMHPFATLGYAGQGLADGFSAGAQARQGRDALEQNKVHQALQLLAQGVKADDPEVMSWFGQIAKQIAPQLQNMPMPHMQSLEQKTERAVSAEAMAKKKVAEQILGRPLNEEEAQLIGVGKQLKEPKEMAPYTMEDGSVVMITADKAAQLDNQRAVRNMIAAMKGGGHGVGGGDGKIGNMVNWHMPDGSIKQGIYTSPPPGATHFTKISTQDPNMVDQPQPRSAQEILAISQAQARVAQAIQSGSAPAMEDQIFLQQIGAIGGVGPSGMPTAPSLTKPTKKKPRSVSPPAAVTGGTDEEPPG